MPYEIHPAALAELHAVLEYYWRNSPIAATGLRREYEEKLGHILEFPESYSERPGVEGVRRANLGPHFGMVYIAYVIQEEKIIILAVAHARRKELYFGDRIPGK